MTQPRRPRRSAAERDATAFAARELMEFGKLSQKEAARRLKVGHRSLQADLADFPPDPVEFHLADEVDTTG